MTITKTKLASVLVERNPNIDKSTAQSIVELFFEYIRCHLERGEKIKVSGFGNFQVRSKPVRPGRNPKTGEEVVICARRVVTFRPSQKLKNQILIQKQRDSDSAL